MSKQTSVEKDVVVIETKVSLNDKVIDAKLKLSLTDLQRVIDQRGPEATNSYIQQIVSALYSKTNENIREILTQ